MNKDAYLYWALAFFVLAILSASVTKPVFAVITALAAVVNFLKYKIDYKRRP